MLCLLFCVVSVGPYVKARETRRIPVACGGQSTRRTKTHVAAALRYAQSNRESPHAQLLSVCAV